MTGVLGITAVTIFQSGAPHPPHAHLLFKASEADGALWKGPRLQWTTWPAPIYARRIVVKCADRAHEMAGSAAGDCVLQEFP